MDDKFPPSVPVRGWAISTEIVELYLRCGHTLQTTDKQRAIQCIENGHAPCMECWLYALAFHNERELRDYASQIGADE